MTLLAMLRSECHCTKPTYPPPKITKSQNHKITGGGGGDVINVIKCDTEAEVTEVTEEIERPSDRETAEKTPSPFVRDFVLVT